jgi:hypothetical protein
MPIEILRHTPAWVFVLFFVLLAAGYRQTKDRRVRHGVIVALPAVMLALSFYGVISGFGMDAAALGAWVIGIGLAVALGVISRWPRRAGASKGENAFFVPGSWVPLLLMMLIFFTKYAVAVIIARKLPIANRPLFIVCVALCYGLFSGFFLARAIVIWRSPCDRLALPGGHLHSSVQ